MYTVYTKVENSRLLAVVPAVLRALRIDPIAMLRAE
jgi:hypothetical protein